MNSFTENVLREYAHYHRATMAHIHVIVSTATSDGEVQAIQERINRIYINEINNESRNAFQAEQINSPSVQGTIFIKDNILSDITEKTLILFKNLEPSIYTFMLTKAIYIFTLGPKGNDQIPGFFKLNTKERIENQRKEFINNQDKEYIANELQEIMKDFSEFENVRKKDIEGTLACLKGIAYEEIHNGLLATKCLTDALSDSKYQDSI